MSYYAVANGRTTGIFPTWNECNESVKGYNNAKYKKFNNIQEAELFIQSNSTAPETQKKTPTQKKTFQPEYYVYTDGSCSNNGRKNASAGIGIYFAMDDPRNVSKKIDGKQTNNIAELTAIIETYFMIEPDILNGKLIAIVSDSEYAIKCVTSYGKKCHKQAWNLEMPNKELVKQAYELYHNKSNIEFIHIKAHTNYTDIHSTGNENADRLANLAIGVSVDDYPPKISKIYLHVPFAQKEDIKKWGGSWDFRKKKWFIYQDNPNISEILPLFGNPPPSSFPPSSSPSLCNKPTTPS